MATIITKVYHFAYSLQGSPVIKGMNIEGVSQSEATQKFEQRIPGATIYYAAPLEEAYTKEDFAYHRKKLDAATTKTVTITYRKVGESPTSTPRKCVVAKDHAQLYAQSQVGSSQWSEFSIN